MIPRWPRRIGGCLAAAGVVDGGGRRGMQRAGELDALDLKILEALQVDGAVTNQELAGRVGLSASQCSRRRAALETSGIIRGYRAVLDAERLGFGITVFISVALNTHNVKDAAGIRDLARTTDAILEAHALTGSADYLLKVVVRDLKELSALVSDVLLPHASVAHVTSNIVLETMKDGGALPL